VLDFAHAQYTMAQKQPRMTSYGLQVAIHLQPPPFLVYLNIEKNDINCFMSTYHFYLLKFSVILRSQIAETLSPMISGPQFISSQFTGLSGLRAMLESYHKLQLKPKTVLEFEDARPLIWSSSPQKAIDNAGKTSASDYTPVGRPTVDILYKM